MWCNYTDTSYLCLLSSTWLKTQRRVPLSCRRSRRSWLRSWERWRNVTCWSLYWKNRGWGRGLRTGTWRALWWARVTSSTGPKQMTCGSLRSWSDEAEYEMPQWGTGKIDSKVEGSTGFTWDCLRETRVIVGHLLTTKGIYSTRRRQTAGGRLTGDGAIANTINVSSCGYFKGDLSWPRLTLVWHWMDSLVNHS